MKKPRHSVEEVNEAIAAARIFLDAPTAGVARFFLKFSTTQIRDFRGSSWNERDFRYDDERARALITQAAAGDATAAAVLRETAIGQLPNLPPNLAGYVGDVLMGRSKKRSRVGRHRNSDRDILIYFAVEKIRARGFSRMRNSASEPVSACTIVATALSAPSSEKNIERVWHQVRRSILP
jgi:hypothetical protein